MKKKLLVVSIIGTLVLLSISSVSVVGLKIETKAKENENEALSSGYWEFTPPFENDNAWKFAIGIGNNVAKSSVSKSSGVSRIHVYHDGSSSGYGWAAAGTKIWNSWTAEKTGKTTFSVSGSLKGDIQNDYESAAMIWGWIQIYNGWPDSHEEPIAEKKIFEYHGSKTGDFSGSLECNVQDGKSYSVLFDVNAGADGWGGTSYANFYDDSRKIELDKITISAEANLYLSPNERTYNFGSIEEDEGDTSKNFYIRNNGGLATDVRIKLEGDDEFHLCGHTYTYELHPGQEMEFYVKCYGDDGDYGNKDADIVVTSSNCDCSHLQLTFKANIVEDTVRSRNINKFSRVLHLIQSSKLFNKLFGC